MDDNTTKQVAKISNTLATELQGKEFAPNKLYNPVQDKHNNWIISLTEAEYLPEEKYEIITFEPKEEV